jgi:hypothetical protein
MLAMKQEEKKLTARAKYHLVNAADYVTVVKTNKFAIKKTTANIRLWVIKRGIKNSYLDQALKSKHWKSALVSTFDWIGSGCLLNLSTCNPRARKEQQPHQLLLIPMAVAASTLHLSLSLSTKKSKLLFKA